MLRNTNCTYECLCTFVYVCAMHEDINMYICVYHKVCTVCRCIVCITKYVQYVDAVCITKYVQYVDVVCITKYVQYVDVVCITKVCTVCTCSVYHKSMYSMYM